MNTPKGRKAIKDVVYLSRQGKKNKGIGIKFKVNNIAKDLGYGYEVINGSVKKIETKLTGVTVTLVPDTHSGYVLKTIYPIK